MYEGKALKHIKLNKSYKKENTKQEWKYVSSVIYVCMLGLYAY